MAKQAISVTVERDNLLWLRGQARASRVRSLSAIVDRLVTEARRGGRIDDSGIRSVVGTVRIATADPTLEDADAAIRALFHSKRPVKKSQRRTKAGGH